MSDELLLVLNAGSSSLKFALYRPAGTAAEMQRLQHGEFDGLNATPRFRATGADGTPVATREWPRGALDHDAALELLLQHIDATAGGARLRAVGHRVVHGNSPVRRGTDARRMRGRIARNARGRKSRAGRLRKDRAAPAAMMRTRLHHGCQIGAHFVAA